MDGHSKVLQKSFFFFFSFYFKHLESTDLHMVVLSQANGFEISDIFYWKGLSL